MALDESKVASALTYLRKLAVNPLQPADKTQRAVLDEIGAIYAQTSNQLSSTSCSHHTSGKKRKQLPSNCDGPKPKKPRLSHTISSKPTSSSSSATKPLDDDDESTDSEDAVQEIPAQAVRSRRKQKAQQQAPAKLVADSAAERNIGGDSPSHFSYFGAEQGVLITDKEALTPLWQHGEPRQNDIDNYLDCVSKMFYHPIEAMHHAVTVRTPSSSSGARESEEQRVLRYSSMELLQSPLRKRTPWDEWSPLEIALFESGMCNRGKEFYQISKIIGTKSTKQVVEFYYYWKQTTHYAIWKALGRPTKKQMGSAHVALRKRMDERFVDFQSSVMDTDEKKERKEEQHVAHIQAQQYQETHPLQQHQQQQQQQSALIGYYTQPVQAGCQAAQQHYYASAHPGSYAVDVTGQNGVQYASLSAVPSRASSVHGVQYGVQHVQMQYPTQNGWYAPSASVTYHPGYVHAQSGVHAHAAPFVHASGTGRSRSQTSCSVASGGVNGGEEIDGNGAKRSIGGVGELIDLTETASSNGQKSNTPPLATMSNVSSVKDSIDQEQPSENLHNDKDAV